jgi:uncharacterized membrane protein
MNTEKEYYDPFHARYYKMPTTEYIDFMYDDYYQRYFVYDNLFVWRENELCKFELESPHHIDNILKSTEFKVAMRKHKIRKYNEKVAE